MRKIQRIFVETNSEYGYSKLRAVMKGKELMKGRTADNTGRKYALLTQRKIPMGRNIRVRQSNLIRNGTNPFPLKTACILVLLT